MNRGMIKWQPFAALTDQNKFIKEMKDDKFSIEKPELSEDQLNELNEQVLTYYYNQDEIIISFYKGGHIYEINGVIKKIDSVNKILILTNGNKIPLKMLINIKNI